MNTEFLEKFDKWYLMNIEQKIQFIYKHLKPNMEHNTIDNKATHTNIHIFYKNWKNITSERNIIPVKIWYGRTEFHNEEQWFMESFDLDKNDIRNFALKDILSIF